MREEYEFDYLGQQFGLTRIRRELDANKSAIENERSLDGLIDLSALLDTVLAERLTEIRSPLDRESEPSPEGEIYLPALNIESVRSFLLFCLRLGSDLDERTLPGRDEEGELGVQFFHPILGLLAVNFGSDGEAWLAWSDISNRRGSCRCLAGDLLTDADPVVVFRWLRRASNG